MLTSDPNRTQLGAPPVLDPNKTVMGAPNLNATQTIKPVQCPVCKTFNPAGVMFCVECGLIFDRALPGDAFGAPAVQLPVLVDESGREYPLRPGQNVIGREGDVSITHAMASRRHAQISLDGDALFLEDLGSTNGTKLNGQPVVQGQRLNISSGDTVSFAGYEMKVSVPGVSGATQVLSGNKTAAIGTPPRVEQAPGYLIGGDAQKFALKPGMNTFGRKPENDVQISDPYVSGRHGIIELAEDGVYLTDIGSTNGTLLNEAKLAPNMRTKMAEGDVIRLGSLEFRVELAEEQGA
jgi:pSer/pThr/pTyr-binding forkhead associated (FHA) protein